MPNIKSAKKRVKVSAKKEEMNVLVNSTMKNAIKKTEKEIKAGNKEEANKKLNTAIRAIDKAKAKGLVHKNKAAREKSRLTKLKNEMK